MWRIGLAAFAGVLATTAHADFRTEVVEVIAQVGAKTVTVLIEKRAEISGTLVLNVIGSAIYDKSKEWMHGSEAHDRVLRPEDEAVRTLFRQCANGQHNIFCPELKKSDDAIARAVLDSDLRGLDTMLNKQGHAISDNGIISKPAATNSLNNWLNSPSGANFLRESGKLQSHELPITFVGRSHLEGNNRLDALKPLSPNPTPATKP